MTDTSVAKEVELYEELYWPLVMGGLGIVLVLAILVFFVDSVSLLIPLLYVFLSFKVVPADYIAGAFFYGKALKALKSGPHFVPFLLMQIRKAPRRVIEFQCPDEPENVFKGDDKDEPPRAGMKRAIRIVTGESKDGKGGLLKSRMTITVSFFFRYAVEDVFAFVVNLSGDMAEVERQLRDIGESTVSEFASQMSPEEFLESLKKINDMLDEAVNEHFRNSGIRIINARLISPDLSREVSISLASIPKEEAARKVVEIKAAGEKKRLEEEGAGKAAAKKAMLEAEAEGRKKIMDQLNVTGEAVLAAETASKLAENAGTIVVGAAGGLGDIIGALKAGQTVLKVKDGGNK